jgi:DNA-binding response OmpR family regulator
MTTLSQVIAERDQALAEAQALRRVLRDLTDDTYQCPGEAGRFTKRQARIVCALKKAGGRYVSRGALMDALYFDRVDDPPEDKILDIWICKIRQRLLNHRIETLRGVGWRLLPLTSETHNA